MPWDCGQSMHVKTVDLEYCTHLAINWGCVVEINQETDYYREAGQARNGVDLLRDGFRLGKLMLRHYRHVPISSIDRVGVVG
jgi:hypothetical protein